MPEDLSDKAKTKIIEYIQDLLWFEDGGYTADKEWECTDFLSDIANYLIAYGLGPDTLSRRTGSGPRRDKENAER